MHVGFHLGHYLLEVLDVVCPQAGVLDFLFQYAVDGILHFHAPCVVKVEEGVARVLDHISSDEQHSVVAVVGNYGIERGFHLVHGEVFDIFGTLLDGGEHHSAFVNYGKMLVGRGGEGHYQCRGGHHQEHQHRHEQCGDYETFFGHTLGEFTVYDYAYVVTHVVVVFFCCESCGYFAVSWRAVLSPRRLRRLTAPRS